MKVVRTSVIALDETVPTALVEVLYDTKTGSGLFQAEDSSSLGGLAVARLFFVVLDVYGLSDNGWRRGGEVSPLEGTDVEKHLLSRVVDNKPKETLWQVLQNPHAFTDEFSHSSKPGVEARRPRELTREPPSECYREFAPPL